MNQLEEKVPSGESYLVKINPIQLPNVKVYYFFYKNKNPYLANFFELNCEFNATNKLISFFDGYAQEVLDSSTAGYKSDYYQFDKKVTEADLSNYNHKIYMIYVVGYETETKYDREIRVGEI